jgi:hypothetical protein
VHGDAATEFVGDGGLSGRVAERRHSGLLGRRWRGVAGSRCLCVSAADHAGVLRAGLDGHIAAKAVGGSGAVIRL